MSQLVSLGQESGCGIAESLAHTSQAEIKMGRFWGRTHFPAHSGCGQNALHCGWRTEVTISLLAVN